MAWKPNGTMMPIPQVQPHMEARGVNSAGTVVGVGPSTQGFLWKFGYSTVYSLPSSGSATSRAYAINEAGDIAGAVGDGFNWRAVLMLASGSTIDLGTLGESSLALATTDAPVAAGMSVLSTTSSYVHGFVWIDGTLIDVGTLGGNQARAYAVTAMNWPDPSSVRVVGSSEMWPGGPWRAFLWKNGTMAALPNLPGSLDSAANGINKRGEVVGWSGSGETTAVLWTADGVVVDLNDWLPAGSGWVLTVATAINENGQIVGLGYHGVERAAFLITP
jgi:probable HAF family extracellular repeat protein